MPTFSKSSAEKLATCDRRLQDLFSEVIKLQDCTVVCGFRDECAQNEAYDAGFSHQRWPNGKHNRCPSLAVDVVPYPIDWADSKRFQDFAVLVKECAVKLGIEVDWGGGWADFVDFPHWQVSESA